MGSKKAKVVRRSKEQILAERIFAMLSNQPQDACAICKTSFEDIKEQAKLHTGIGRVSTIEIGISNKDKTRHAKICCACYNRVKRG